MQSPKTHSLLLLLLLLLLPILLLLLLLLLQLLQLLQLSLDIIRKYFIYFCFKESTS